MSDDLERVAALIVDVADSLDGALTVPHSPIQAAMRRAMDAPRPGDLVVVMAVRRGTPAIDRVGHYVESWPEFVREDGLVLTRGHTIRRLDGGEARWTNVKVVRVSGIDDAARDDLDARRSPAPAEPSST